jgi:hypothetical protein
MLVDRVSQRRASTEQRGRSQARRSTAVHPQLLQGGEEAQLSAAAARVWGPKGSGNTFCRNSLFFQPCVLRYHAQRELTITRGSQGQLNVHSIVSQLTLIYYDFCEIARYGADSPAEKTSASAWLARSMIAAVVVVMRKARPVPHSILNAMTRAAQP